ncbi:MAG: MBL fold metallo-hydrolase [Methanomassiliicoccales archaeon]|nr:MBL fold metallo-hydrolase [Methanomassiliicoccales archaeon]
MVTIIFLGSGGGRFSMVYQVRRTGGIYIKDGGNLHIDPGPGAVVALREAHLDPAATDAILISHAHPDHYVDAEVLVEGMTRCNFSHRGLVAGAVSAIEGRGDFGPVLSAYHRRIAGEVRALSVGEEMVAGGLMIRATPTKHSDPDGIGFRISTSSGVISYVSDSELDDDVVSAHQGARVLIMCVTRPLGSRVKYHLATEDAAEMTEAIRPEVAVLTHFGSKLVQEGAEKQARYVQDRTGVRTIAARDFMRLTVGKAIRARTRT